MIHGRISAARRHGESGDGISQRVGQALRETLAESKLPLASAVSAVICETDVPSGSIASGGDVAFRRLIHLSLLKLDFLDVGQSAHARGKPLVDLRRWALSPEVMAGETAADDEVDSTPTPATKREIVEQFKRDELLIVVDAHELTVQDRRVREMLIDAVVRSKKARVVDILGGLSRDRLKEICVGLELPTTGREKAVFVERICGDDGSGEEDEVAEPESNVTEMLSRVLGSAIRIDDPGTGWPIRGALLLGGESFDVNIYARTVGGSSRGNDLERRLQNPSQKSPIVDEPDRHELLLGLWTEQGTERTVVVAFEAYRRLDRATRFSLFMPLSLLEQAADTGFATHENNRGETVYAFRPDNIGRYFQAYLQGETWRAQRPNEAPSAKRKAELRVSETLAPAKIDSIYIRPRVGMYSAFARLNYKPWFALAEFIDNSVQSFLQNRDQLVRAGHEGPLVIDVNLDDSELSVTDRAGGIAGKDFPRAFSPASPPDDATGLSEFGLGMKAAACWFSKKWSVRTSALGEGIERTVSFDVPKISKEGLENLPIDTRPSRESDHFTVVTMNDLRVHPRGRTLMKIRDHLASIYRVLMAEGVVKIRLTSSGKATELEYRSPDLLDAPHYAKPSGSAVLWRQEFAVDFADRRATGWAGIMKIGSHSLAGFSVFRRRRLVDGSIGETYKPHLIFGSPNSFASQRVIGEIFVDGFDVTHTKDGIQWHGYEDELLESIARQLNTPKLPLLDQADGYRARTRAAALPSDFGVDALSAAAASLSQSHAVDVKPVDPTSDSQDVLGPEALPLQVLQRRDFKVTVVRDGKPWNVQLKLVRDPAAPFYSTSVTDQDGQETVSVEINLDHEFSVSFINDSEALLQPLVRFIAALALGERLARNSGAKNTGLVRQIANQLLREMSSVN